MSTLFERNEYDSGVITEAVWGDQWVGQTFTIGNTSSNIKHTITSISLYCKKEGSPSGIGYVYIYETSSDLPTGSPIATGSFTVANCPSSKDYYNIVLSETAVLYPSIKYAFVIRCSDCTPSNWLVIHSSDSAGYTGGNGVYSPNAGLWWNPDTYDLTFREYGNAIPSSILTITGENYMTIVNSSNELTITEE